MTMPCGVRADDAGLAAATPLIWRGLAGAEADIASFIDPASSTITHVVSDPHSRATAIIDAVLGHDPVSGRMLPGQADRIVAHVRDHGLDVHWHLETHVHADHVSAAAYLKARLGGQTATGSGLRETAAALGRSGQTDHAFDRLLDDGDCIAIGELTMLALHLPGHTPGCTGFVVGSAVFVGDTLMMPDVGTARADFPGGDVRMLYNSIRRLLSLPEAARLFVCHDYPPPERQDYQVFTTVGAQRRSNIHVGRDSPEGTFVALRTRRDATLAPPAMMAVALAANIAGGAVPDD
jgi:glyoxylase-like metal-dependent hydrolase (beta-lactamase superfamily II)